MFKLFYISQRKHLNDLLKNAEELNIPPKEIMNKYMNILVSNNVSCNPKEELEIAYKETIEFYREGDI